MLFILLVTVTVQVITCDDGPMLFISISFGLEEALSFKFVICCFIITKTLKWLNWLLSILLFLLLIWSKAIGCRHIEWSLILCIYFYRTFVSFNTELAHTHSKCLLWVYRRELSFQFVKITVISDLATNSNWLLRVIITAQLVASYNFVRTLWCRATELIIVIWLEFILLREVKIIYLWSHSMFHRWIRPL